MKTDLVSTIAAAIAGFVIAFLVCSFLMPEIQSVSFKELSGEVNYELAEPDVNVFNYRALNPTVEVYVGSQTGANEGDQSNGSSN